MKRALRISLVVLLLSAAGVAAWAMLRSGPLRADATRRLSTTPPGLDTLLTDAPLPPGLRIDSILAIKHERLLVVFAGRRPGKAYRVALGDAPVGHKQFEGDERTPEGHYYIDGKNPNSQAHKSLGISYPNAADKAYAARHGKRPGGLVKIHGIWNGQGHIGKAHLLDDWTNGCIATTDEEIDEIYERVRVGTPILILP